MVIQGGAGFYTSADVLKPEFVGQMGPVQYSGEHGGNFLAEIRTTAGRRRRVWGAPHSCDCAAREVESGVATEKEAIAENLRDANFSRWVSELGVVPDHLLLDGVLQRYGDGRDMKDKDDTREGHLEPLDLSIFLVANPKALDLLRLPEHREMLLTIKKYLSWVYVPSSCHV
jgi:hypothetical protein